MKEDFNFRDIIESAHDIVVVTEVDTSDVTKQKIVYVNPAFTELTEYSYEDAVGKKAKLLELFSDDVTKNKVREALEKHTPVKTIVKTNSKSGKEYWLDLSIIPLKDKNGNITYNASIERDVTNEKKLIHELEVLSRTDPLTGLLNRRALVEVTEQEIVRYQRTGTVFCILVFDLDYFKKVNDTYGHSAGDKVLQVVAKLLNERVRLYDFAARTGGEEFCILISNTSIELACGLAERIRESISELNIYEDDQLIKITTSIGISEVSKLDSGLESILKRADEALYCAKAAGRNCVSKWDSHN